MADKPHYLGHRERLRQRLQRVGAEGFQEYELLELLLSYAIPRKDVKPLAKGLLKRFGNLAGVLDAPLEELGATSNLGPASATLIRLVKELCAAYLAEKVKGRDVLSCPQAVVDFARTKLAGLTYEAFMILYLNTKNEVMDYEIVHEGTVDRAVVYPRRVMEAALARHASGLILVHNHPSGHPEPSEEDRRLTSTLAAAAHALDIRILDHIVVGKNGYVSFRERHLMPP